MPVVLIVTAFVAVPKLVAPPVSVVTLLIACVAPTLFWKLLMPLVFPARSNGPVPTTLSTVLRSVMSPVVVPVTPRVVLFTKVTASL